MGFHPQGRHEERLALHMSEISRSVRLLIRTLKNGESGTRLRLPRYRLCPHRLDSRSKGWLMSKGSHPTIHTSSRSGVDKSRGSARGVHRLYHEWQDPSQSNFSPRLSAECLSVMCRSTRLPRWSFPSDIARAGLHDVQSRLGWVPIVHISKTTHRPHPVNLVHLNAPSHPITVIPERERSSNNNVVSRPVAASKAKFN
jgi:hypothetical protein